MKKSNFLLSLFLALFTQISWAQYCGAGSSGASVCVAGTNLAAQGFDPSFDTLPCVIRGVPHDQVVQVKMPATLNTPLGVQSFQWIQIDSVGNLPCGLCWSTNKGGATPNRFNSGEQGCIRITGTSYESVGQFYLTIIVTVRFGGILGTQANQDAGAAGLKYFVRVSEQGGICTPVDTLLIPGQRATAVGATFTATVDTGSVTRFCQGGSVRLIANPKNGSNYRWFKDGVVINGANDTTYTANASGNYTVNIVRNCRSVTSSARNVNVLSAPLAAITPGGPVQICGGGSATLKAGPSGATSYTWKLDGTTTGGSVDSLVVSAPGNYTVDVLANGCSATSNTVVVSTGGGTVNVIPTASSLTICAGDTVTLDAGSGYDTYVWSNTAGTQTTEVTAAGTYIVSVTLGSGGCASVGVDSIIINSGAPVPAITALPDSASGCQGSIITLDAGAGFDTYDWSNGGGSQTITPNNSGTYTVSATKVGTCGVAVDSTYLTVKPLPIFNLVVTASADACVGQQGTLDAGAGYDSYSWSSTQTTQTIPANVGTPYTVTVTKTENGCTRTATAIGGVGIAGPPPTPPVSDENVCPNDSVLLDGGFGYSSYKWSTGASSQFIYAKNPATYTLTVTRNGFCDSTVVSVDVTLVSAPNTAFTKSGNTLVATQQGAGISYTWFLNGNPIPSSNTATLTITQSGNYSLEVDNGTCRARSAAQAILVGITDIGAEIGLMVAPNPAINFINVMFSLSRQELVSISIFDMNGKRVMQESHKLQSGDNTLPIDVSQLASGIYTLGLQTADGFARVKISKK